MNRAFLAALIVLVALAAIAGGCGGGEEGEPASPLTKAQFIEQGDEICKEADERSEEETEELAEENDFTLQEPGPKDLEEVASEVLAPNLKQQAEELAALAVPRGDEKRVEAIVGSLEEVASEIEDDPALPLRGDVLGESRQLAAEYGFEVCGAE